MLTSIFLDASKAPALNLSNRINVNYDPIDSGSILVTGVTVTNLTENSSLDLTTVLDQVTTIGFRISGSLFELPVTTRTQYPGTGTPIADFNYIYLAVTPTVFPVSMSSGNIYNDISIYLVPYIVESKYYYNDYNPLTNNTQDSRRSRVIQISDRNSRSGSSDNPANIDELRIQSASLADVQDSNYTSTGWINARYVGTSTSAGQYKGISPAITGKTYSGEVYANTVPDSLICSRSLSDRLLEDLLQTSENAVPTSSPLVLSKYVIGPPAITGTDSTLIEIQPAGSPGNKQAIDVGSILQVDTEYMKVQAIIPASNNVTQLEVVRGYLQSTAATHSASTPIYTVPLLNTFKFDTNSVNVLTNSNSKIWVKDSKEILYTDGLGTVYSGSFCSF